MSFVKHRGRGWTFFTLASVKLIWVDRAEERAGPEDVGDQTLMRGLVTALPFVRPGLSCLGSGIDHVIGHTISSGVPLAVVPPSLLHD